jgi:hypothetical protein
MVGRQRDNTGAADDTDSDALSHGGRLESLKIAGSRTGPVIEALRDLIRRH